MAGYMPSPGHFKGRDADPEATHELFLDYLENMERVFMLSRQINPANGQRVDWGDEEKKAMLLVEGGEDVRDLFKHVGNVLAGDTYLQAIDKIKVALTRRGNRTSAVHKLFTRHPQGSQSFDAWHKEVSKAANLIEWEGYNGSKAAVDAIIMQTSSEKLKQRALQENPTYDELVKLGISQEQARMKSGKLPDGESDVVGRLQEDMKKLKRQILKPASATPEKKKLCERCCRETCKGGKNCFAEGRSCFVCGGRSHFSASKLCSGKKVKTVKKVERAKESGNETEDSEPLGRIIDDTESVKKVGSEDRTIYAKIKVAPMEDSSRERTMRMAADTGSRKTILSRSDWEKIQGRCTLLKTKINFRAYGTDKLLPVRGRVKVLLRAQAGAVIATYVYVNDDDRETSLLGRRDAERLGIVQLQLRGGREEVKPGADGNSRRLEEVDRIKICRRSEMVRGQPEVKPSEADDQRIKELVQEFKDVFSGVGKYKGEPVRIQIDPEVVPVIQPPRRIPHHYQQPLKDHLEEMLKEDIIEGPLTEEEKGTWISNLVITDKHWEGAQGKPGQRRQIRANLDLRSLNKHVYQTHEPIPTPEELRHEMRGSRVFSTLDMVHSFHQFVLEEEARKLFAFRTPDQGLMRFKRLVMGNNPASSEAHRRVKKVVAGLPGVLQIKDDVVVHGANQEEHDERLRAVLQRFREAGLTLRQEKCHLSKAEVKWFGMIYSKEGMTADPEKVKLIRDWPAPRTVKEVKSFLQTVQFNAIYLAAEEPGEMNFPELTSPLRVLTHAGVKFTWTEKHQKHFDILKDRLCSDKVMVAFDPKRDTRIYTDGGTEGAQATVAQKYEHPEQGEQWRPVAHTARAWVDAEKRYSQIEKESNALMTGIVANKTYLLGKEFEAVVDHKPLLPLYNTPRRPKQMRVDRHRMKLAGYNFKVVHVSGTKMPCDYGSRRGCPEPREYSSAEKEDLEVEEADDVYVNRVLETLPSAITMEMMQEATKRDLTLQKVVEDLREGKCRNGLTGYTHVFNDLALVDGVVMRGEQLVIPRELQAIAVQLAHEGHILGSDKTTNLLRETCWFPGMSQMVRQFVETCKPCLAAVPGTVQEPLRPTMLPEGPWQRVHADYKGPIGNKFYLHTFIDQYSKYPVVEVCTSTSWEQMEPMLDKMLGELGNMETLTTDGGPPYDSKDWARYMKREGIRHHVVTPENPQANGFVEAFQKVLIKVVHTAIVEKKDPRQAVARYLKGYRAAPHKTTGTSPYEMMYGRKMKTKLPQVRRKPDTPADQAAREKHDQAKKQQKEVTDIKRRAKEKPMKAGDEVMVKQKRSTTKTPWDPQTYKVVEVKNAKVKVARGERTLERAKNNLKLVKERPEHLKPKGGRGAGARPEIRAERRTKANHKERKREELDLEVSWGRIRDGPEPEEQPPGPLDNLPDPPHSPPDDSGPDTDEEDGPGDDWQGLPAEAAALLDPLSKGRYWGAVSDEGRTKRRPARLGEDQLEREDSGFGEDKRHRLPPGLRQGTPVNLARMECADPAWGGDDEPVVLQANPSPRARKRLQSAAKRKRN